MERKIGEISEYNGEWYQCVESRNCGECSLFTTRCGSGTKNDLADKIFGKECSKEKRSDNRPVIFKKLEKVGEPYRRWLSPFNNIMVQRYRLYGRNVIMPDEPYMYFNAIDNTIEIELKQTKEDMEDLDKIKVRDYTKVEELNVMEEKKLNLKPFDIQKAKKGKPVCTRDGKKARILCYDLKGAEYPIVAAVETHDYLAESISAYDRNGRHDHDKENNNDLMMLPEKKEGWVNVYYDRIDGITFSKHPYPSKEEAIKNVGTMSNRIDTVKISWEE